MLSKLGKLREEQTVREQNNEYNFPNVKLETKVWVFFCLLFKEDTILVLSSLE